MKQVLVTGANGFVGGHLCALLRREGIRVRALLRQERAGPWDEAFIGDLRDGQLPAGLLDGVDGVFHLAGRAHVVDELGEAGAAEFQKLNVEGTRLLLNAAKACGAGRFLLMSSVKAMGEGGEQTRDESDPSQPETPYGRSKQQAEQLVLTSGLEHPCVLRPPLVYGPGGKGNLERMIAMVRRGWFPPPPRLDNQRSMIHVHDLAVAALLALRLPQAAGRIYLVTDGQDYATWQIHQWILEAMGLPKPVWRLPFFLWQVLGWAGDGLALARGRRSPFDSEALQKLLGSASYSSRCIRRELGFVSQWTLQRALPEMVRRGDS